MTLIRIDPPELLDAAAVLRSAIGQVGGIRVEALACRALPVPPILEGPIGGLVASLDSLCGEIARDLASLADELVLRAAQAAKDPATQVGDPGTADAAALAGGWLAGMGPVATAGDATGVLPGDWVGAMGPVATPTTGDPGALTADWLTRMSPVATPTTSNPSALTAGWPTRMGPVATPTTGDPGDMTKGWLDEMMHPKPGTLTYTLSHMPNGGNAVAGALVSSNNTLNAAVVGPGLIPPPDSDGDGVIDNLDAAPYNSNYRYAEDRR